ncbi:hypothetical protein CFIO01_03506 [Colletotrichum fioriniae PJ7]|uniref:Uncharacterized protein n=1 Tax=Colletotrichum fioriniae PJ7 TaxID=1445577 RepID=A0A010QJ01_9PEZI|nr:hypothetical protein CFIO01_03506 [Colletotrichum fioriniae PJ7]
MQTGLAVTIAVLSTLVGSGILYGVYKCVVIQKGPDPDPENPPPPAYCMYQMPPVQYQAPAPAYQPPPVQYQPQIQYQPQAQAGLVPAALAALGALWPQPPPAAAQRQLW